MIKKIVVHQNPPNLKNLINLIVVVQNQIEKYAQKHEVFNNFTNNLESKNSEQNFSLKNLLVGKPKLK